MKKIMCNLLNIKIIVKKSKTTRAQRKLVKKAIAHNLVVPYFQPVLNMKTSKIEKYECLARIKDGNTVYSPFHFINAAKDVGLYGKITKIMIDTCFIVFGDSDYDFSINLDMEDLGDKDFRTYLFKKINKNRDAAKRFIIEILETDNFIMNDEIEIWLNNIRNFGVKIAIDDFGNGYANLDLIHKIMPDILKIDGSLIRNIEKKAYLHTVKAIVNHAKSLNIKVVAEFVENESIMKILHLFDVDYAQGYFISPPNPQLYVQKHPTRTSEKK